MAEIERGHGQALDPAKVGMASFLVSEVAFFGTLVMTYIYFLMSPGDPIRPLAREVFSMPLVLFSTVCLLSSSVTVHYAVKRLEANRQRDFRGLLGLTILLGVIFLIGTAFEWRDLIRTHRITIASDVFGTAYFTLVGFHAAHVTIGLILLSVVLGIELTRTIETSNARRVDLVSWYWHFVDGVWVVVFSTVYLAGR